MHPYNDFRGYLRVDLCNNGYKKPKKLHRVVAEAFCEHPIGKEYVNHINFDRHDCRACNLEWVTQQENIIHMYTRAKLYPSECQPTFDSENALPY